MDQKIIRRAMLSALFLLLAIYAPEAIAQQCQTAAEMPPATRSAIESAAQQYFEMTARGDLFGLRQAAIPDLASNFGGIEKAVIDNKPNYAGTRASVRSSFLLTAEGTALQGKAEFFCGIFNSPQRVGFLINNLPSGRYAVVVMDATGGKAPAMLSLVLQEMQGQWKLAGFVPKPALMNGRDASWYLARARELKSKGLNQIAWFYYMAGLYLTKPLDIMYTAQTDKIADEIQQVRPAELPSPQKPLPIAVGPASYSITEMTVVPEGQQFYLRVQYQTPSVGPGGQAFQNNIAVAKAVIGRYPELRELFTGLSVRAVDPTGADYWSPVPMKDLN
jgi:hypothetical protein